MTQSSGSSFWAGRRVLITGHTGFKGSWLALWARQLGATISGFALPPGTTPSLYELADVDRHVTSHIGDVRDHETVQRVVASTAPEIVFHLAAQSLVRYAYGHPVETVATNVLGTAHLLNAIRDAPTVRVVIVVTSDKCYENREALSPCRETDPLGGRDPYSASKGATELITAAFRRSYFEGADQPALASVRAGNVIGGGDWAEDRLIPDLAKAFSEGRVANIRHPSATRPWQHVLDALSGYLVLAEKLWHDKTYCGAWNFGPSATETKPVAWIADRFAKQWGRGARWAHDSEQKNPYEAASLQIDSTKARAELGWKPRLTITEALDLTFDWYRAWASGKDMYAMTSQQIRDCGMSADTRLPRSKTKAE